MDGSYAALHSDAALPGPSSGVLRKLFNTSARALMVNRPLHQASSGVLSKAELRALGRVGLAPKPWVGNAANDPLVQTIADYMALIETSLSTAETATMLSVDVSRIRQRIREKSLFALDYEGEWRLPRFQFERKKVLPGLAAVLVMLPEQINPLDVATWFLEPNIDLEGDDGAAPFSPRQWLLRGGAPQTVAQIARHL